MAIRKETQYWMDCDVCDDEYISYAGDRKTAISFFRENCGWKIGKKCVCPDCQKKLLSSNDTATQDKSNTKKDGGEC